MYGGLRTVISDSGVGDLKDGVVGWEGGKDLYVVCFVLLFICIVLFGMFVCVCCVLCVV